MVSTCNFVSLGFSFENSFLVQPGALHDRSQRARPMKRPMGDKEDEDYIPVEKRVHYEEKISNDFNDIRIEDVASSSGGTSSPIIIEQQDLDDLDEAFDIPTTSDESNDCAPVVEEPDEVTGVVLSDELRDYIKLMKRENFLPSKAKNGKELVLYNSGDDIRSRISEITDEDYDIPDEVSGEKNSNVSTSPCSSPQQQDAEMTDGLEDMEVD